MSVIYLNSKRSARGPHHSEEFKQAVVDACREPRASVAGIALTNGVNANLVRRWLRDRGIALPTRDLSMPVVEVASVIAPEFVQLPLAPSEPVSPDIRIEIQRGNTALKVDWPVQAAGDCAAWLRVWLR